MHTPKPVELVNDYVRLSPITLEDALAYLEIGKDNDIWQYLTPEPFQAVDDASRWIRQMLARSETAGEITFSVFDKKLNRLAGSSSYIDIRQSHGALEIGFTWYGTAFQRSHVNTATKLALLTHAFEELEANRVQLQTDARNQKSQTAIARLGAVREGVLRMHKIYPSGYVRDSVLFSITIREWPEVKKRLLGKLAENYP